MGKVRCSRCKKWFDSTEQLVIHTQQDCIQCPKCSKWISASDKHECVSHKCDKCGKRFTKSQLVKHLLTHEKSELSMCTHCDKVFANKNSLSNHMRVHSEYKSARCPQCKLKCSSKKALDQHLRDECKQCDQCQKFFSSEEALENHDCKPRKCSVCGKVFKLPCKLTEHMVKHTGETPFQCTTCGNKFKNQKTLKEHINREHLTKLKCQQCRKVCASQEDLDKHLKEECQECVKCHIFFPTKEAFEAHKCKATKCNLCGEEFSTPKQLGQHLKTHGTDYRFECRFCGKKYCKVRSFKNHIQKKHGTRITCVRCKKPCASQDDLDSHLKEECQECVKCHIFFKTKKAFEAHKCKATKCNLCGEELPTPKQLAQHLKTHGTDYRFECRFCGKKYSNESSFKDHIRRKHGTRITCVRCKKPCASQEDLDSHLENECKQCDQCEKFFPSQEALEDHDCKPRKCTVCGKNFKSGTNLANHTMTHRNKTIFECIYCDKTYTVESSLNQHLQRKHGKDSKDKAVTCAKCKKICATQEDLDTHLLEKCLECVKCLLFFPTKDALEVHKCKPKVCDVCGKMCKSASHLAQHILQHKVGRRYQCKFCCKRFTEIESLRTHEKIIHRLEFQETSDLWKCQTCDFVVQNVQSFKIHQISHWRCECGQQFQKRAYYNMHKTWCGKKCKYCEHGFLFKKVSLMNHQLTCKKRNDFQCSHCEEFFDEKKNYIAHVRNFCQRRKLSYKCPCCKTSEGFDPEDVLQILEHVMKCKPTTDKAKRRCYLCHHKFGWNTISLHVQDELLNSRLFKDIPCDFECVACKVSYPTDILLKLHMEIEHPLQTAILNEWDNDNKDLDDFDMPERKKGKLIKKRRRIQKCGLESFAVNGKFPSYQCYICHCPYHSEGVMRSHVRLCEKKYGIKPKKATVEIVKPSTSKDIAKKKRPSLNKKHNAPLLQKMLDQIKEDVEKNPWLPREDQYWGELERRFKIEDGYAFNWLTTIIRDEPELQEFFKDQLDEVRILEPPERVPKLVLVVDMTEEEETKEPEVEKPQEPDEDETYEKPEEDEIYEEPRNDKKASLYFKRKQAGRRPKKSHQDMDIHVEELPDDKENLSLWMCNNKEPKYRCEICRRPYHSEGVKNSHARFCGKIYDPPQCVDEKSKKNHRRLYDDDDDDDSDYEDDKMSVDSSDEDED